jgi:putative tryptophan/tyrosine transport system substrate-binding protein
MRRREFVTLIGGAAVAYPLVASAQQPSKLPTIGYLGGAESVESDWLAAFVRRFGELGWIEGRTVPSKFAGQKAARSALPRLQLSSCGKS